MKDYNSIYTKKATFIQHILPGLEAGDYEVRVQQTIQGLGTDDKKRLNEKYDSKAVQPLSVTAPRFSIDPSTVHLVYPPRFDLHKKPGPYNSCVPHIIIKGNPALPWMREATEEHVKADTFEVDGVIYDKDRSTWMAVLLIPDSDLTTANGFSSTKQEDVLISGTNLDYVQTGRGIYDYKIPGVYDLSKLDPKYKQGSLPSDTYSLFSHESSSKNAHLGIRSHPLDASIYMDLDINYFHRIAPTLEDLKYMAHVRQVDTSNAPKAGRESARQNFSVVLGNRIPQIGMATAYLVSLESMESALPESGKEISQQKVRLPVLSHWSFAVGEDKSLEFEEILQNLNQTAPAATGDLPHPRLNLMDIDPNTIDDSTKKGKMLKAIGKGYVPLNHLTGGTDTEAAQTVSWYRGPLVPYKISPDKRGKINFQSGTETYPVVYSADIFLRYDDKDTKMLDTSYAAAWQLGQLLCLEDKTLSQKLYQWKRYNEQAHIRAVEQAFINSDFESLQKALKQEKSFENEYKNLNHTVVGLLRQIFTKKEPEQSK